MTVTCWIWCFQVWRSISFLRQELLWWRVWHRCYEHCLPIFHFNSSKFVVPLFVTNHVISFHQVAFCLSLLTLHGTPKRIVYNRSWISWPITLVIFCASSLTTSRFCALSLSSFGFTNGVRFSARSDAFLCLVIVNCPNIFVYNPASFGMPDHCILLLHLKVYCVFRWSHPWDCTLT